MLDEFQAGRAMDELVAEKVMGLVPGEAFGSRADHDWASAWDLDDNPSKQFYCRRCWTYADEKGPGPCDEEPPPFSTNIGAAWQVIERLQELGCNDFGLDWEREKFGPDKQWMYAMNAPRHLSGSLQAGMPWPVVLHAETAPLAICRAALRAVGAG